MKSVLVTLTIVLGMASPASAQAPMLNAYGGAQPNVAPGGGPPPSDFTPQQPPLLTPAQQGVKGEATSSSGSKPATKGVGAVAPAGEAVTASANDLPFTGLDLLLLLAGGSFLVAVGLGMRRLSRAPV